MRKSQYKLPRLTGYLLNIGIKFASLVFALINYDVFIFSGQSTFLAQHDFYILKLLKKKIIVVYFGSDARPPVFSGRHLDDIGKYTSAKAAAEETVSILRYIKRVEKYADVIINHTATAQFFSIPFIRWAAIGLPIPNLGDTEIFPNQTSNSVRILHAPSRPKAKGSEVFRRIMDELRWEGFSIDFIELSGVPNAVVLQELQKCDFVVDELYSDTPMAMFATEAAMFGKPAIVGGYYAKQFFIDNPDKAYPPSIYVEPAEIKSAITKLIRDADFRHGIGRQAKEFVTTYWRSEHVARNYLRLIEGDFPESWISNPVELDYFFGWGLSRESWRQQVNEYVANLGVGSLYMSHNHRLVNRVVDELRNNTIQ